MISQHQVNFLGPYSKAKRTQTQIMEAAACDTPSALSEDVGLSFLETLVLPKTQNLEPGWNWLGDFF